MVIKKYLQKVFKKISYNFFLKIYGSINSSIKYNEDDRIKVKTINPGDEINYRVYKISNGRLYTDRIHDTAAILDDKIIEGPSFQIRYETDFTQRYSKINDNIVLVITSSKHRNKAYEASEFIMEYLKSNVPFWKKEVADTTQKWVENS